MITEVYETPIQSFIILQVFGGHDPAVLIAIRRRPGSILHTEEEDEEIAGTGRRLERPERGEEVEGTEEAVVLEVRNGRVGCKYWPPFVEEERDMSEWLDEPGFATALE
ncbi:unnamed protein product [Parascedosporium putredinis]|uniref:Uncharacterized protein n=1 Tax=Parascedosporium putredinis TaxID=1442378 RepID=A0A9P1M521_9PEZI|nr:unnamed protein product [Parascedosporium putredinis]CAI7987639.1 unnamed protein product [Parascedosporium putredinis]